MSFPFLWCSPFFFSTSKLKLLLQYCWPLSHRASNLQRVPSSSVLSQCCILLVHWPFVHPAELLTKKRLWKLKAVAQRQPLGLNRAEQRVYSPAGCVLLHGREVTAEQPRRGFGPFSRCNSPVEKEGNWSLYQGFPKTELSPADFGCISSLWHSQIPKPNTLWEEKLGQKYLDQKISSPAVYHRRAPHSECSKGST